MSPEAQRIAIAESLGWTRYGNNPKFFNRPSDGVIFHVTELSKFTDDLNAMHEAEKTLKGTQWTAYIENIRQVVERIEGKSCHLIFVYTVTAAQRAEAYLRTIGRWKD